MKHIITATVENQPGVLARIVGLISGRGYNIETLSVGPTSEPDLSQMTMTIPGDTHVLHQVSKQLNKMVEVIKVSDFQRFKVDSVTIFSSAMKLSSIPQLYRNMNRWTEILKVLSKYGLADWINQLNLDFAKGVLKAHDGEFADMNQMLEDLKTTEQIYRNSIPDITHNHIRLLYSPRLWSTIFSRSFALNTFARLSWLKI